MNRSFLLFFGEVEEKFEHNDAVAHQIFLEVIDVFKTVFPYV